MFTTTLGDALDVNNARRDSRVALKGSMASTLPTGHPVSCGTRSSRCCRMPVDRISRLVGHAGTSVTELVYRHQIRPLVREAAEVMDSLFAANKPSVDAQLDARPDADGDEEPTRTVDTEGAQETRKSL